MTRVQRIAVELIDSSAESEDKLLEHVMGSTTNEVYKTPAYKGGRKYLTIIETKDKEGSPFYHVQRLGQDSVAFMGYSDDRTGELLGLKQWSAPYQEMVTGTFTGSLDKDGKSVEDIVIEEAHEEAGLEVTKDRLKKVGEERVGGSTDETVHLYLIDITGLKIDKKNPENKYEELAQRLWLTLDEIQDENDWRAKIIANYYAGHTLEDKERANVDKSTKQKAAALAARPAPMLGWRTKQGRDGAMYYLQNAGFDFHADYVMEHVQDPQGYNFAIKFMDAATYQRAKAEILDRLNKPGKLPFKVLAAATDAPTDLQEYGQHGPILDVPPVNMRDGYDYDLMGWHSEDEANACLDWMKQRRPGPATDHMYVGQHTGSGAWQIIDGEIGSPFQPTPDEDGWHKAFLSMLSD